MLGRKDYTPAELKHGREMVAEQLATWRKLAKAAATTRVETAYFNNMLLALDRLFVHRIRMTAGKDCNPVNEVELLVESLINHDAVLTGNNVFKYSPEESVVGLKIGDRIALTEKDYKDLSGAFLDAIEEKFL